MLLRHFHYKYYKLIITKVFKQKARNFSTSSIKDQLNMHNFDINLTHVGA